MRRVRHRAGSSLRGQFNYTVDGRGNRTRAFERLAQSTTVSATLTKTDTAVTFTRGTWTDAGDFKQTAQFSGRMQIAYTGDEALLTIGTGPDHGQFDLYINDTYWRRFDAYATTPAERVIHLPQVPTPTGATSGVIEIRNRSDRHHHSTGRVFRFKQLAIIDTTYTDTTIDYTYDALSRLTQADYDDGTTVYDYAYDLAGNLTNMNGTTRIFNAANQLTNDGAPTPVGGNTLTYDPNGNLTSDGTHSYTWDHANRMLTAPNNTSYTYDGLGNRISQSIGTTTPTVTQYLLDTQPGLTKVLAQTTGTNTNHFIHAPRGIHAMQNNAGDWSYMAQDGLGSVRSEIDSLLKVSAVQNYAPYGEPFGGAGNFNTPFAFTGEPRDASGLQYHRARYYNPSLAIFPSLDPFEGTMARPMSLNGYSWVEGNTPNMVDPSGMQCESLEQKLTGGNRYWCEELQNTLNSSLFEVPSFEEVFYCYSCAMDNSLGDSPEAYEQGIRQAESDGMGNSQRNQFAIDEYRRNYVPSGSLGSGMYSVLGIGVNGYAIGIGGAVSALVAGVQVGVEVTYNFATFQRMRFRYLGSGGIFQNILSGLQNLDIGFSASNYVALVSGFTRPENLCQAQDPFEQFKNEYKGAFNVHNQGGAYGAGGGVIEFHSPDGSIFGGGFYLSAGVGWDIGYSQVHYTPMGLEKSYINPIDGKVDITELTMDIRYSRGMADLTGLPLLGEIPEGVKEEAIRAAESLAIQYNSSSAAKPCSC